jgi:hypothetical protein
MGQSSVYELLVQPDGTLKPNGSVTLLSDLTDGGLDAITVAAPAKSTECVCVAAPPGEVYELAVQPGGTLNSRGSMSLGGSRPSDIKVHPNQHFICTAQIIPSGAISVLTVNESVDAGPSCAATLTSTLALPENEDPSSIAIEPMGKFAYTSNVGVVFLGSVGEFSINSHTGAVTQIGSVNSENPESASTDPVWVVTTN